jgi:hypothetical protein
MHTDEESKYLSADVPTQIMYVPSPTLACRRKKALMQFKGIYESRLLASVLNGTFKPFLRIGWR